MAGDGDYYGEYLDDDYDGGWGDLVDSGDFGEWLLDDDGLDPELNGSAYYDDLLEYEYADERDASWERGETPPEDFAFAAPSTPVVALPPGALRFGAPPSPRSDTPDDPEIWHLTHVYNFKLMCERGVLAPTPKCPFGVRPGLQELVGKRALRPTEWGPTVGSCVPFYFTVATPFSYRVLAPGWQVLLIEPTGTKRIQTQPSHYVFLRSTVRSVVAEGYDDWMVTDGNAAAMDTKGWQSLHHLHCVDWSAVNARWSPSNQTKRQAELLVDRDVDLNALTSVHAATEDIANLVTSFAGPWADRVVVDPPCFARARGR